MPMDDGHRESIIETEDVHMLESTTLRIDEIGGDRALHGRCDDINAQRRC